MTHFLSPHASSGKRDEAPHGPALLARQSCRWEAMHVADEMNFPPQESLTPRNTLQGKTSDAWWFEVRNFKALTRRHSRRQSEASAPAALLDRMFSSVLNHIYIPVITLLSFCAVVWSSRRWNTNSELVFCAAWSKLFDPRCLKSTFYIWMSFSYLNPVDGLEKKITFIINTFKNWLDGSEHVLENIEYVGF